MDQASELCNLKTQPDLVLVNNIKAGQLANESLEVLGDRHSGLYIQTVSRLTGDTVPNLREDLLNDKLLVLYHAAQTFDTSKGTLFSTHFANETKWSCLKGYSSRKRHRETSLQDEILESIHNKNEHFTFEYPDEESPVSSELLAEIEKIPDSRARIIMRMRYFTDEKKNLAWKNIGAVVQLSVQGCINIHNKWIKYIEKNIKRNKKEITLWTLILLLCLVGWLRNQS